MSQHKVRFEELPLGLKPETPNQLLRRNKSGLTRMQSESGKLSLDFNQKELILFIFIYKNIIYIFKTDLRYEKMPFEPLESTVAYRPTTSNAFRVPFNLSDPIGSSHYDEIYTSKYTGKAEPIRTGTASGTRSNNPHPSNVIINITLLISKKYFLLKFYIYLGIYGISI